MKVPFNATPSRIAGSTTFSTASATRYLQLHGQITAYDGGNLFRTTEGDWRLAAHADGTISDFAIFIVSNARTTPTDFTLMVNGVSSGYTITVGAGVVGWVGASAGGPVAVAQGDLLSVRMVTGTGTQTISLGVIAAAFAGDGDTVQHFVTSGAYNQSYAPSTNNRNATPSGTTESNGFADYWGDNNASTQNALSCRVQTPGTASRLRVDVPLNTSTEDVTITLMVNGVASALAVTIPAGVAGVFENNVDSVALAEGDVVLLNRNSPASGSGSYRIGNMQFGVVYDSEAYDVWIGRRGNENLIGYNDQAYYNGSSVWNVGNNETSAYRRARSLAGTLSHYWIGSNTGGGGADWDVTLRRNGVDQIAVTVPGNPAGTYKTVNSANEVTLADEDTLTIRFQTSTFASGLNSWGFTVSGGGPDPVTVDAPAGELEIDGGTPFVTADEFAYPEAGALEITGSIPTVVLDLLLEVPAGALEITGSIPTVVLDLLLEVPAGALEITGGLIDVDTGITVQPPGGTLEIEGGIPFVATDFQAVASQAAILALGEVEPVAHASQAAVLALGEVVPAVAATQAAVLALVEAVPCVSRWSQCWLFIRTDGEEFAFTSHDSEVQFMGRTFEPCHSLQASATEAATDVGAVGNMELSGIIDAEAISEADLYAGKFDACRVEVWEVPWDASDGSIPRRLAAGQTGSVSHGRDGFRAEVLGIGALIQQQALTTVVSPACRWVFGDAATCGKDLGPLTEAAAVTAVGIAERRAFASAGLAALALNDGYFSRGVLTFTTGENAGFKSEVKDFAGGSGVVILWNATPRPISAGDEFTVSPGCTLAADGDNGCKFWNNYVNFGGFPDVPGNDAISETPDAKY